MGTLGFHVGEATAGGYVAPEQARQLEAEYYSTHPHVLITNDPTRTAHELYQLKQVDENKSGLKAVSVVDQVVTVEPGLGHTTIVPQFSTSLVPEYSVVTAIYKTVPGFFSPAPVSIFGIGRIIGVLEVRLGKRVVAQMAMDLSAARATQDRVGFTMVSSVTLRIRSGSGEGRGRPMNLRGADGATPGGSDDAYDEPGTKWYEPWTWFS